jgi:hypothetical protein
MNRVLLNGKDNQEDDGQPGQEMRKQHSSGGVLMTI